MRAVQPTRIHITGSSGSGTTTLGRALARSMQHAHFDADDYYWLPPEPVGRRAFEEKRRAELRNAALLEDLRPLDGYVVSGSIASWYPHDLVRRLFDRIVCLWNPTEIRLARLRAREKHVYGAAIEPGGAMHEPHRRFLEWAARYDTAGMDQRSRMSHEAWLARVGGPQLRLEDDLSVEARVERVRSWLGEPV